MRLDSDMISAMIFSTSSAVVLDCSASLLICWATTANPRPASPALAASILAFKERRSVSSAIFWIIVIADWMDAIESFNVLICSAIFVTEVLASSLEAFNSPMITSEAFSASDICSACLVSESTSSVIYVICSPIRSTLCFATPVSSACVADPLVISSSDW